MGKKHKLIRDDFHARVPVDRVAVRVTMFPGVHFDPDKRVTTNDSDTPLAIRNADAVLRNNPSYHDLTGTRFGRFVVVGLARDFPKSWVVRCDCGRYSTRKSKSITNPNNAQDRCEHCRHLAFLKREEHYRRTGKDTDINNF